MAKKHASIYWLKMLVLALSEDDLSIDWVVVEELYEAASTKIKNSLADYHYPKQPDLPLASKDIKGTVAPKKAEAIFSCSHCQATGPASEGITHHCEEMQWSRALERLCGRCGGYIAPEEGDLIDTYLLVHKVPCVTQESAAITAESHQLPDKVNVDADGNELPAEDPKQPGLPETATPPETTPFDGICLSCGDNFTLRTLWAEHLTTHQQARNPVLLHFKTSNGDLKELTVNAGEYSFAELKWALGLRADFYLWATTKEGVLWERFMSGMHYQIDETTGYLWLEETNEASPLNRTYRCDRCKEEITVDDVTIAPDGMCVCDLGCTDGAATAKPEKKLNGKKVRCTFCDKQLPSYEMRLISDPKGYTCREDWKQHTPKDLIKIGASLKPGEGRSLVRFDLTFTPETQFYFVTEWELASLEKDRRFYVERTDVPNVPAEKPAKRTKKAKVEGQAAQ